MGSDTDTDRDLAQLLASAQTSLKNRDPARALVLLRQAQTLAPGDPSIWQGIGVACLTLRRPEEAANAFRSALKLAPNFHVARLQLGDALVAAGQSRAALLTYHRALRDARMAGQWLGDASTPPALRASVQRASRHVVQGQREIYERLLAPLRARYGRDALARVEQCVAMHLGEIPRPIPDPRQRPLGLYFPGIPALRYPPRERLPWLRELEGATDAIRHEALKLAENPRAVEPFHGRGRTPEELRSHLAGTRGTPSWDAAFFYRHGQRFEANAMQCPATASLLESLPLVRIPDIAPEICFSILRPGTHILPHSGVTNTRVVVHLPLVVPPDCALNVAGEVQAWQPGRCLVFDDTFEHEAWNRSDAVRIILLMDAWNPHLTEVERAAVTDLTTAIAAFNRDSDAAE